MKDKIAVIYSCDESYVKIMAVSMISLFETNIDLKEINVYCLLYEVDNTTCEELNRLGKKYKRRVVCINAKPYCDKYRFWKIDQDSKHVRLLTDKIIQEEDIILYLDCDVIINDSLMDLISLNIGNYYVGAVLDTCRIDARLEADIKNIDYYFNSGVMLINLKMWRNNNLYDMFANFQKEHDNRAIYSDQRILNGTMEDKYYLLPIKYNVTPEIFDYSNLQLLRLCGINSFYNQSEIVEAREHPIIIHFAGRSIDRPWYSNCEHPYRELYRQYMLKDEFTKFPLKNESIKNKIKWKLKKNLPFSILLFFNKIKNRKIRYKSKV